MRTTLVVPTFQRRDAVMRLLDGISTQATDELDVVVVVDRVELFSAANTSAPRHVWELVGGFYEGFVGWGAEDYELALRLRDAGVTVRYDDEAVAWHLQRRGIVELCRNKEGEGANCVRV